MHRSVGRCLNGGDRINRTSLDDPANDVVECVRHIFRKGFYRDKIRPHARCDFPSFRQSHE